MIRSNALIFDLDGPLVDSAPGISAACRAAAVACGYDEPADTLIRPLIGLPLVEIFCAIAPHVRDPLAAAAWCNRYRLEFDRTALPVVACFPGVPEHLTR